MSEPTPPTNVRAIMDDGREIPLECTYRGFEDGVHVWVAYHTTVGNLNGLLVGELPPHTAVSLLRGELKP